MKKELILRKNIYTGKEHKLIWSGAGKLYYFKPAEDWMPVYLHYSPKDEMGHEIIVGLDSDGFGHPLYLGDVVNGKEVAAIIEIDDKIGVMFK